MSTGKQLALLPWFVRDYVTATRHLSLAERGAYTDLLWFQWEHGVLPFEAERLARLLGCGQDEFEKVWPAIQEKFTSRAGGLVNLRLEEHREKALRLSAKRAILGRAGGTASARARRGPLNNKVEAIASPIAEAKLAAKSNSPSPSPSPNQEVLEDSHLQEREIDVRRLLNEIKAVYPLGIYRQADWLLAEREILQRLTEGEEPGCLVSGSERYRQQADAKGSLGTQYITSPQRFFRERQYRELFPLPAPQVTPAGRLREKLERQPVRTWEPPDDETTGDARVNVQ